jgi:hypothetical protein
MYLWVIVSYHFQITFERSVVGSIETSDGRIESNVSFREMGAEKVWRMAWLRQMLFNSIQSLKKVNNSFLVRLLRFCKSRFVDAVVDRVVYPLIHFIYFTFELWRKESGLSFVDLSLLRRKQVVESGVEHPNNLTALIADNGLVLLVPQCRYQDSSSVRRVCFHIQIAQILDTIDWIFICRLSGEAPALDRIHAIKFYKLDYLFESLQTSDNVGTVRPRASWMDVQDIASCFCSELLGWNKVTELRCGTLERAILVEKRTIEFYMLKAL